MSYSGDNVVKMAVSGVVWVKFDLLSGQNYLLSEILWKGKLIDNETKNRLAQC